MGKLDHIGKEKRSLQQRGLPHDSFFHVCFHDGVEAREHDTNWSSLSKVDTVKRNGREFQAHLCEGVKSLTVSHGTLSTTIDVPEGCAVYQAIHSQVFFTPDGRSTNQILARSVGIVKDGNVIEERMLMIGAGEVIGYKI